MRQHLSQNKISVITFVIECHGFPIFCLKPLKTIQDHPLKPLGAPDFVKMPPFQPPEKLSILEVQNPLVFQIDIAPTFFVQFWLAASQNDRTDCPLKMPYSRDPQVKRQISYWPREVQPLRPICSMTPMFGGQFFFGPGGQVFYVD